MPLTRLTVLLSMLSGAGCGLHGDNLEFDDPAPREAPLEAPAAGPSGPAPAHPASPAPAESARQAPEGAFKAFQEELASAYQSAPGRRVAIQVDKPLYRPGETLWFRALDLRDRDLSGERARGAMNVQLLNPKGATTLQLRIQSTGGAANNAFDIPEEAPGGRYLVRVVQAGETLADDQGPLAPAHAAQGVAIEELQAALALLSPPPQDREQGEEPEQEDQEGGESEPEPQEGQDESASASENQQAQEEQPEGDPSQLLQGVRDREAERRRERERDQERRRSQPVDKDW